MIVLREEATSLSLRAKKVAQKREDILYSAITIIAEKGYHGTTMEDIASRLLMTKGSLYYYFKNKQELVYESQIKLLNKSLDNFKYVNGMEANAQEKLIKMIQLHTQNLVYNKAEFELMIKPEEIFSQEQLDEIYRLREEYAIKYDELLKEGIEDGSFDIKEDEIKIVRNLLLGAMNWVTQWHSLEGDKNLDEFTKVISKYIFRIVKPELSSVTH